MIKKKYIILLIIALLSLCACSNEINNSTYIENQELTINFEYGERTGKYTGHLVDGLPDGIGKFTSKNAEGKEWTYVGEWKAGHFNGQGTSFFDDGSITVARYENDCANGEGIILSNDDSIYKGNIQTDQPNGNGTYLSLLGNYSGDFINGLFNGNGTYYYTNGSKFEGIFKDNLINGKGTFVLPNGEKIVGTFSSDTSAQISGTGTYYSKDGIQSICTVSNGKITLSSNIEPEIQNLNEQNKAIESNSKESNNKTSSNNSTETITDKKTDSNYKKNNFTLKYGKLLESNPNGGADGNTLVIKAKIEPNLTNDLTISQNYHNIIDLVVKQGCDTFDSIDYWAVADMTDGSEQKVISFLVDHDCIEGIKSETIYATTVENYLTDLWILPSLAN